MTPEYAFQIFTYGRYREKSGFDLTEKQWLVWNRIKRGDSIKEIVKYLNSTESAVNDLIAKIRHKGYAV